MTTEFNICWYLLICNWTDPPVPPWVFLFPKCILKNSKVVYIVFQYLNMKNKHYLASRISSLTQTGNVCFGISFYILVNERVNNKKTPKHKYYFAFLLSSQLLLLKRPVPFWNRNYKVNQIKTHKLSLICC